MAVDVDVIVVVDLIVDGDGDGDGDGDDRLPPARCCQAAMVGKARSC